MVLSLFDFVVFATGPFVPPFLALCFRVLVLLSIGIISLGEERARLCASRAFV